MYPLTVESCGESIMGLNKGKNLRKEEKLHGGSLPILRVVSVYSQRIGKEMFVMGLISLPAKV